MTDPNTTQPAGLVAPFEAGFSARPERAAALAALTARSCREAPG